MSLEDARRTFESAPESQDPAITAMLKGLAQLTHELNRKLRKLEDGLQGASYALQRLQQNIQAR